MSVLDGKAGSLAIFGAGGDVVGFVVFNDFPVSSSREPDFTYTKTENGWASNSGEALSVEDAAELDALVTPQVVAGVPAVEPSKPDASPAT